MPNVIDSLVVELGLDPRQFNEGQRQARESFKRTQEEAKKGAAAVEFEGKKVIDYFESLKRAALGVTGVLLGGMGIKEFTGFLTNLDAATARVAKTMDISANELSAWQGVAEQTGGSAEGMTGTLQNLSSEINKFQLTGQSGLLGVLVPLGVKLYAANGQLKTSTELFLDLADAVQGMDPARARALLSRLGMDQNAINLEIEGRRALQARLETTKAAGATTKESAAAAQQYQEKLSLLERAATNVGRVFLTAVLPSLNKVLDAFTRLIEKSPATAAAIGAVGSALAAVFAFPAAKWLFGGGALRATWRGGWLGAGVGALEAMKGDKDHSLRSRLRAMLGIEETPEDVAAPAPWQAGSPDKVPAPWEAGGAWNSRGDRNNNPGNIKMGPVARQFGAVSQDDQGHAIFPTWERGNAAQAELLRRNYSGLTLDQIGAKYAEDPNWAAGVARYGGFARNRVPDLSDPAIMDRLQAAIRKQEGTHVSVSILTGPLAPAAAPAPLSLAPWGAEWGGIPFGAPAAAAIKHSSSLIDNSRGDSSHTVSIETGDFYINAPGARTNTDIGKEVGAALHGAAGQQWAAALGAFNSGLV